MIHHKASKQRNTVALLVASFLFVWCGMIVNLTLISGFSKTNQRLLEKHEQVQLEQVQGESPQLLQILIAKTVGIKDIDSVVLPDVEAMTFKGNIHVHWRFFCYDLRTHEELMKRVAQHPHKDYIAIVFAQGQLKNYFWQHHLTPESIPDNIDYVWMQDGDMSIREMDWQHFWHLVNVKYRPAIFMPAHHSEDLAYDKTLWHAFTVHYRDCDKPNMTSTAATPYNHYSRLQAVEVENFETCLPAFRRDSWAFVHAKFNEKLPDWGQHETDWGPGQSWCSLVEREFLGQTPRPARNGRSYNETQVKNQCTVATTAGNDGEQESVESRPISCLILHPGGVKHHNSQSYSKKGTYRRKGKRDEATFMKSFGVNKELIAGRYYHRVFFAPQ